MPIVAIFAYQVMVVVERFSLHSLLSVAVYLRLYATKLPTISGKIVLIAHKTSVAITAAALVSAPNRSKIATAQAPRTAISAAGTFGVTVISR